MAVDTWAEARERLAVDVYKSVEIEPPILEVGSGTNWFYRDLFAQKYEYRICDCWPDIPVDDHYDIHNAPYADAFFGAVIMMDVLEHLTTPAVAIRQVHRVLRPGGHLLASVPLFGPGVHGDFWRFTHYGLENLLTGANIHGDPLGPLGWQRLDIKGVGDARHPDDTEEMNVHGWSDQPKYLGYLIYGIKE